MGSHNLSGGLSLKNTDSSPLSSAQFPVTLHLGVPLEISCIFAGMPTGVVIVQVFFLGGLIVEISWVHLSCCI